MHGGAQPCAWPAGQPSEFPRDYFIRDSRDSAATVVLASQIECRVSIHVIQGSYEEMVLDESQRGTLLE